MEDNDTEFPTGEYTSWEEGYPGEPPGALSVLERDLEEFLVNNLDLIEPGLKLYENNGQQGRQYSIDGGRIDLLCEHRDGDVVVVELKACEAADAAVGQLLGYVGYVSTRMLWGRERTVRGVLVAPSFSERAIYAASLAGLKLLKCRIQFSLEELKR